MTGYGKPPGSGLLAIAVVLSVLRQTPPCAGQGRSAGGVAVPTICVPAKPAGGLSLSRTAEPVFSHFQALVANLIEPAFRFE
jgi:hypothetical protein